MLQNMRDGASRWLIWLVIVIVIIALSLWGISSYFMGGGAAQKPVAKVNGQKISQAEFNADFQRLRMQQPKLFSEPGSTQKVKKELLKNLINKLTLAQGAREQGFAVGPSQINAYLTQIPAFQIDGQFSQAQFSMILNRLSYTPAQFMQTLQNSMLISQVQNGIAASTFVLPAEARHFAVLIKQKRNFGYMLIPTSRVKNKIKITEQQIKDFYQQHKTQFQTPEQVSLSYIEVTPKSVLQKIKTTPTELMNYYENNISQYTKPARWRVAHILLHVPNDASAKQIADLKTKLENIRQQIEKGASFAVLAKKDSQDILTANKGGEMPWFTAGTLGPVFEGTVAKLKPGQISYPVQTRYGLELIKLLAQQKQQIKPYHEVANEVKRAYKQDRLRKIMANKNDDLANSTLENPNSLQATAKQLGLTVQHTRLFTQKGEKTGIAKNLDIVNMAFSENLLQGANSDVVTLKNGGLLVFRIKQHILAATKPLQDVRAKVKQQLLQQQAKNAAEILGKQLVQKMNNSQTAKIVAEKNNLTWAVKTNVSRTAKNIDSQILQKAFNLSAPKNQKSLTIAGLSLNNGDYVIIGLMKIINGKANNVFNIQARQQLNAIFAQSAYVAYSKRQRDKASIKYYLENMG